MNDLEEAVCSEFGFDSMQEFHRMVASVDIASRGKYAAFKCWQENDGTKKGLTALLESAIFCEGCDKRWNPERIIAWNRADMSPLCLTCGSDCRRGLLIINAG